MSQKKLSYLLSKLTEKKMNNTKKMTNDNIGANLLIVDDEVSIRNLLNQFLSPYYKVRTVSSADEALDLLKTTKFDLAISDINMPGKSGKEFFRICQKEYPDMHIILMTGLPELSDAVNTVKEGAYYYLPKPIDLKFLLSLLKQAIAEKEKKYESDDMGKMRNLASDYKVIRSIGTGASGVVLLVEKNNVQYAMKVLRNWNETINKNSEKMQRFIREAETLSKINNDHVVKIYDHNLSKTEDSPYIIMEYVKGSSLVECLKNNTFNIEQKISIILQIAEALECVHAYGVLHRDIKPENILITEDMKVKITDFGICHIPESSLTMVDEILGSPAYMAPESFDASQKVDARSDIFSMGIISYEMFTGNRPFDGDTVLQIMESIKNRKPVAPTKLNRDIPPWMQDILAKMLNKNPDERYNSAGDVVKETNYSLKKYGTRAFTFSAILKRILFKKITVKSNVWE
jgi:DNA-binding response OmpR family regulator